MSRSAPTAGAGLCMSREPMRSGLVNQKPGKCESLRRLHDPVSHASLENHLAAPLPSSSEAATGTRKRSGSASGCWLESTGAEILSAENFNVPYLPSLSQTSEQSPSSQQRQGLSSLGLTGFFRELEGSLSATAWRNQPLHVEELREQQPDSCHGTTFMSSGMPEVINGADFRAAVQTHSRGPGVPGTENAGTRLVQNAVSKREAAVATNDVAVGDGKMPPSLNRPRSRLQARASETRQSPKPVRRLRSGKAIENKGVKRSELGSQAGVLKSSESVISATLAGSEDMKAPGQENSSGASGRLSNPPAQIGSRLRGCNAPVDSASVLDISYSELTAIAGQKKGQETSGTGASETSLSASVRGDDTGEDLGGCPGQFRSSVHPPDVATDCQLHGEKDSQITFDSRLQDGLNSSSTHGRTTTPLYFGNLLDAAHPLTGGAAGTRPCHSLSTMALHVALMDPNQASPQPSSITQPESRDRSPSDLDANCSGVHGRAAVTSVVRFKITSPRVSKPQRPTSVSGVVGVRGARPFSSGGPSLSTSGRPLAARASTGVRHPSDLPRSRIPAPEAVRSVSVCHRSSAPGRREERHAGHIRPAKVPPRDSARWSCLENGTGVETKLAGCSNALPGRPVSCPPRQARNRPVEQPRQVGHPLLPLPGGSVAGAARTPLSIEDITRPRDQGSVYSIVLSREPFVTRPGLSPPPERCRSVETRRHDQRLHSSLIDHLTDSPAASSGCGSGQVRSRSLLDTCRTPRRHLESALASTVGNVKPAGGTGWKLPPRTVSWTDLREASGKTPGDSTVRTDEGIWGGCSGIEADCLLGSASGVDGDSSLSSHKEISPASGAPTATGNSSEATYSESCVDDNEALLSVCSELSRSQSPRPKSATGFRRQNIPPSRKGSASSSLPLEERGTRHLSKEKEPVPGSRTGSRACRGPVILQGRANKTDKMTSASELYSSSERPNRKTTGSDTGSDEAPRRRSSTVSTSSIYNHKGSRRGSFVKSSGRVNVGDLKKIGSFEVSGSGATSAMASSSKSWHEEKRRQTDIREVPRLASTPGSHTASQKRLLVSSLRASVDPLAMAIHAKLVESGIMSGPLLPSTQGIIPSAKRGTTGGNGGLCLSSLAEFDPWQSIAAALAQVSGGCDRCIGSPPSGPPWRVHTRNSGMSVLKSHHGGTRGSGFGFRYGHARGDDDSLFMLWADTPDTASRKYYIETTHFKTHNGIEGTGCTKPTDGYLERKQSFQLSFFADYSSVVSTDRRIDRSGGPAMRRENCQARSRDYVCSSSSTSVKRYSLRPKATVDETPGIQGSSVKAKETKSSLCKSASSAQEPKSTRKAKAVVPAASRVAADKSTASGLKTSTSKKVSAALPRTEVVPETLEEWQELNNATGKMVFSASCPPVIKTELLRRGWAENPDPRSNFFHFRWVPSLHSAIQSTDSRRGEQRELALSTFQSTTSSGDGTANKGGSSTVPEGFPGERLLPYQLTNRFLDTSPLTTKIGLLKSLRANMPFLLDSTYKAIMPRCYSLNLEDHVSSFKEDYVFTQTEAVLKLALLAWALTSPASVKIAAATAQRTPLVSNGPTCETVLGSLSSPASSSTVSNSLGALDSCLSPSRFQGGAAEKSGIEKCGHRHFETDTSDSGKDPHTSGNKGSRTVSLCSGESLGDDPRHMTGSTSDEIASANESGTEAVATPRQLKNHLTLKENIKLKPKPVVPRLKLVLPALADPPGGKQAALISAAGDALKSLSPYAVKAAIYVVKRARAHLSRTTCCMESPVNSSAELKLLEHVQLPRFTATQSMLANGIVESAMEHFFQTRAACSKKTASVVEVDRPTSVVGCPDTGPEKGGKPGIDEDHEHEISDCIPQLIKEACDALHWLRDRGCKQWNVNGRHSGQRSGNETGLHCLVAPPSDVGLLASPLSLRCRGPLSPIVGWGNLWILKPADNGRGARAEAVFHRLSEVDRVMHTKFGPQMLVQKFVECPLTICGFRAEVRQWVLVTSWNPLTVWLYKKAFVRLLDENKRQGGEKNGGVTRDASGQHSARSTARGTASSAPKEGDIRSSDFLQTHLQGELGEDVWSQTLYPRLKKSVIDACRCVQIEMDNRPNSYELFGFDFAVDAFFEPWLLEVSRCSELSSFSPSSPIHHLAEQCLTDSLKVVLDWSPGNGADTGLFELIYRGASIHSAVAIWARQNLHIEGHCFSTPAATAKGSPHPVLSSAGTSSSLGSRSRAGAPARTAK
ncbi:tubulin-tyrosine ligase family protein [Cystoisospora suis]|uniref:Tubulin-tyrosine ligase family protein n=1 Tax=Cystoisospora suis TaxID=483139 RepID=A0A2C6KX66_9APIC|nr:tubulin-tyrosine ligase family protein [Cystoisospora suis]